MGKIFTLITSFALSRLNLNDRSNSQHSFSEIYESIVEKATDRVKDIVLDLILSAGAVVLIAVGFFVALFNSLHQYDLNQFVSFNTVITGSLVLILLGAGSLYYSLSYEDSRKKKIIEQKKRFEEELTARSMVPNTIQSALTLLVVDFLKEREFKRQIRLENQKIYKENLEKAYDRLSRSDLNDDLSEDLVESTQERYLN